MKQSVTITRLADRHKDLHGRDFAETEEIIVQAGGLEEVLIQVIGDVQKMFPSGRYSIVISEPFD